MAEKVVSVALQARTEGFVAGMRKAKASLDDLTKAGRVQAKNLDSMSKAERKAAQEAAKAQQERVDAFRSLSDKAAVAGLGVATAVGVAVKRFADFDEAMSAVKANSGETGQSLDALRNAAIQLGADSQFSATEAAQGINELAKAGIGAADVLQGGLKGSLDLAAAGQISVADAAETAATAITQFKLSGSDVPHVADLLANAANKAQGGVGDMAQALKQGGLVASSMGLSIEETTAGLTAFAAAGLLGSDAGTSLKTMLQRLANPSDEAATAMEKIGLQAYDAQGNFVGLAGVAGQLKAGLEDLTPAERDAAMATIFGSDAVRAANVLYSEGAEGINKWTDAVNEQGAAAKQAATLTDNLKGDIERLGGALDSVFIQTGSGANNGLRSLTQGVTRLVDQVGDIPSPVMLAGGALVSLALLAPRGIIAYKNYAAQLDSLGLSIDKVSKKAPRMATALRGAQGALAGLAVAGTIGAITNSLTDLGDLNIDTSKLKSSADAIDLINQRLKATADLGGPINDTVSNIDDVLSAAFSPSKAQKFDNFFASINSGLGFENTSDVKVASDRMAQFDTVLTGLVTSGNAEGAKAMFDGIAARAALQGKTIDEVKAKFPQYREALNAVTSAASESQAPQTLLAQATEKVGQTADEAKKALDDLRSAIEGLGSPLAAQRAAERDFQQAIDDSADRLKKRAELQKELKDAEAEPAATKEDRKRKADDIARITAELEKYSKGFDVNTEAGRANQAALDNIRNTTLENVAATYESTKNVDKATDAMKRGRDAFIEAATAAGMTKDEAGKLATKLGLVPKDVKILVSQSGAEETEKAIDQAARDRTTIIRVQRRIANERDRRQDAANSDPVRKASGGAIYGAGTATSDSIPALLSNGEHVLTAAEVRKMGGQAAVYALRAAIRAGNVSRFAEGGAVAAQSRFAPVQLTIPSQRSVASDGLGRQFVTGSLDMGNGLTGFVRAIVADEMAGARRSSNLGSMG